MASRAIVEDQTSQGVVTGRRQWQRARLFASAILQATTREYRVTLSNLSCTGAMAIGSDLPNIGRAIVLKRDGIDVLASVVWKAEESCGLAFDEPLELDEVLALARRLPEVDTSAPAPYYWRMDGKSDRITVEEWQRARTQASRFRR